MSNLRGALQLGVILQGKLYLPEVFGGTPYKGTYVVNPNFAGTTLETEDKILSENVVVNPIEVARVSNPSGGKTVFIGGNFDG